MNSSQEETYHLLMDYFTGRRERILTSNSPSYIRAEIGSWGSFSISTAKGEVEANVTKRNGGSYVNFSFNFFKEYVGDLLITIVMAPFIYFIPQWFLSSFVSSFASSDFLRWFQSAFSIILLAGIILLFSIVMVVAGYATSSTRNRFIDEFNMFVQSLQTKK
jgi:hypothetical protein